MRARGRCSKSASSEPSTSSMPPEAGVRRVQLFSVGGLPAAHGKSPARKTSGPSIPDVLDPRFSYAVEARRRADADQLHPLATDRVAGHPAAQHLRSGHGERARHPEPSSRASTRPAARTQAPSSRSSRIRGDRDGEPRSASPAMDRGLDAGARARRVGDRSTSRAPTRRRRSWSSPTRSPR